MKNDDKLEPINIDDSPDAEAVDPEMWNELHDTELYWGKAEGDELEW